MSFRKILLMVLACMLLFLSAASADDRSDYPDVDETAFHMTDPLDPTYMLISSDYDSPRSGHRDGIHGAIDFACDGIEGAPVYAVASGTAYYQYQDGGGGNMVFIDHGGGQLFTTYMHLSSVRSDIQEAGDMYDGSRGVHVDQAEPIGNVGHTGHCEPPGEAGAHLHLQICAGAPFAANATRVLNPHDWLTGIPAYTGAGYGHMSPSMKFKFDAAADFFKPVKVFIDKFGEISTKAMELLATVVGKVMAILFVIDFAIGACMRTIDPFGKETAGSNFFTWLVVKAFFYLVLIFFLTHWGEYVGDLSKTMFTSFGAMAFGSGDAETAQKAISDPFDIFQKGVLLVEPLINNFISTSWFSMWFNFPTFIFTMFFAIAILFMLAVIVYQIALVYVEFYIMMLFSFATFMFAGIKQGRKFAARGVNGIFAVSLKLLFFSMFSLMLQGFMQDMKVPNYYQTMQKTVGPLGSGNGIPRDPTATPGSSQSGGASGSDGDIINQPCPPSEEDAVAGITSIDDLLARVMYVESSGRFHCWDYMNSGHYGAFQIDKNNWPTWAAQAEDLNPNITLDHHPCNCQDAANCPEPVTESQVGWTHQNQYIVAKTQMILYYNQYHSYKEVVRAWAGGPSGKDGEWKDLADEEWSKVTHTDPKTGGFAAAMQIQVLQLIVVIKVFVIVLLFMMLGTRIAKLIDSFIQTAKGLKFTNND